MSSLMVSSIQSLATVSDTVRILSHVEVGPFEGLDKTLHVSGNITSDGRVYNAVWNDFADTFELEEKEIFIPGYCYSLSLTNLGKTTVTKKRADKNCIGIASDTFAYLAGNLTNSVPIGVAGRVAAFVDKQYKPGTLLVSNKKGILTKANIIDIILKRPIAKFLFEIDIIKYPKQANRFWVKII